jgi:hypothetical protein
MRWNKIDPISVLISKRINFGDSQHPLVGISPLECQSFFQGFGAAVPCVPQLAQSSELLAQAPQAALPLRALAAADPPGHQHACRCSLHTLPRRYSPHAKLKALGVRVATLPPNAFEERVSIFSSPLSSKIEMPPAFFY